MIDPLGGARRDVIAEVQVLVARLEATASLLLRRLDREDDEREGGDRGGS